MDATPWPQGLQDIKLGKPMEEVASNNNNSCTTRAILERKARPPEQLNCPRCSSTNTKFCYYNNYSLTQPRYFCKTCRRYWTEGGSLRNVPVGGGSRKNKRSSSTVSSSSSPSSASSPKLNLPDLNPPSISQFSSLHQQNPNKTHQGQDLNLGFPLAIQEGSAQGTSIDYIEESTTAHLKNNNQHNSSSSSFSTSSTSYPLSALELLRTGISSRGLNSYIPTPMPGSNTLYSSGFPLQELKPSLGFSVDGLGSRHGVQENAGRILFPFGEIKPLPNTGEIDQSKAQGSTTPGGYWNGMLGGGGSW